MARTPKRLSVSRPEETAAGLTAVTQALKHALGKAGVTRGAAALARVNQSRGFDCPGCAWPEEPDKSVDFCENGAKAIADEATRRSIGAGFFARYSLAVLNQYDGQWLNDQGRLSVPMVRRAGATHYAPIDWDRAYEIIAAELNALDSADEAVFYTSGRTSNEAAFLYQLFVRQFGTNNLPDSSNLCHESSGHALKEALGSGKGTVLLEDFERADAIFILGQNPGSNHPRMLATLQRAKRAGAKIVSVNPLAETGLKRFRNPQEIGGYLGAGTALADLHLPVRVNGDVALLKGLSKAMLEAEDAAPGTVLDQEFIRTHTRGFDDFRRDVTAVSWGDIVSVSGVDEDSIRAAAQVAMSAETTICCWAMGLTQHRNAVANVQEIVNFLLLKGNVGKPGAGACPVRGHSNVQGDRTMGITERPSSDFLARLGAQFSFEPPTSAGLDAVSAIRSMHEGRAKVFVALGGNFVAATPDSAFTEEALRGCRLTVQISTKLNRSHIVAGRTALILPALGRTDRDQQAGRPQFVTSENSMGIVAPSRGRLAPVGPDMRSEVRIVSEMAAATLKHNSGVEWFRMADDYAHVRDSIERVIPGFNDFNRRMAQDGQMVLEHAVRDRCEFDNVAGKALFTVHPLPVHELGKGRFMMMTIRSHDQFNTTVYSDRDRYRGIAGSREVVLMHPDDVTAAGLEQGAVVDITSYFGSQRRTVRKFRVVAYDIPRGCVATYYPETNALVPIEHVAEFSNTPAYKSVVVSVTAATDC